MVRIKAAHCKVELIVMTMTHVWGGDSLIYGVDYNVSGNSILTYRYSELPHKLIKADKLAELISGKNIIDILGASEGIAARSIRANIPGALLEKAKPEIKKHIRVAEEPLIPGSEVKGLIRTALLYYIVANKMINIERIKGNIAMIEYERKMVKYAGIPVELALKAIRQEDIEGRPHDVLSFLSISDPLEHKIMNTIDYVAVAYTHKKGLASKIFIEALDKGSIMIYDFSITNPPEKAVDLEKELIERIKEKHHLITEIMWKALGGFSRAIIEYEKKQMEATCRANGLDCSFVDTLNEWLDETGKDYTYYLKIGFAAGHASKTIYLALPDDLRSMLIKIMTIYTGKPWDDATIRLIGSAYDENMAEPFAWIKLKFTGGDACQGSGK